MDKNELNEIYYDLKEIEAVLGLFASIEEDLSFEYVNIVSTEYCKKVKDIRKRIKNRLDNKATLAR